MSLIATDGYYMSAVQWICKIKRNRLQVWLGNGWIEASKSKATGSGSRNIFDEYDLVMIYLFKRAVENGLSRATIANFIPSIQLRIKSLFTNRNGIIEPIASTDQSLYVFFFRQNGILLDTLFSNSRNFGDKPTLRVLKKADDVIGFNMSKIINVINKRIEDYFK